jgi:cyclopropane-fatty-acyl-phospholipid synthase
MAAARGMKGEGFYDRHSSVQGRTVAAVASWLEEAASTMDLPKSPAPLVVADHGCSEGQNSILAVGLVADAWRKRRQEQSICAIHTDLPANNFNKLFANLHDPTASNYLQDKGQIRPNVYALAAAGSFYHSLLPPASVHFALCFNAIVWMERLPEIAVPDFVMYARGSTEVRQVFREEAARQLDRFLQRRAEELTPGGKLLVLTPGQMPGRGCWEGIYDVINDACLDLVRAGRLDRGLYERLIIPVYFRDEEEFRGPAKPPADSGHAAFVLERVQALDTEVPFVTAFRQTKDAGTYARDYTGFLRAFSEPVVATHIGDSAIVDAVYRRIEERLAAEPERYLYRNIVTAALWTRR